MRQTDTPIQKGVTILHAVGRGTEVAAESPVAGPQEWSGALTQTIYHHRGATAPTLLTTNRMPAIWGNNISACEAKVSVHNGPGYECHPLGRRVLSGESMRAKATVSEKPRPEPCTWNDRSHDVYLRQKPNYPALE